MSVSSRLREGLLRGSPRKDLGPPRVRKPHHAQGKRRGEDGDHAELRTVGLDDVEACDGADQQDGRHQDADDGDGDGDGAFIEATDPRPAVPREFILEELGQEWKVEAPPRCWLALTGQCRRRNCDR